MVRELSTLGVTVRRNADRKMSFLNVGNFTINGRVTYVGHTDHVRVGIVCEKAPDFDELQRTRKSKWA
jgi:hypothetical protein